MKVDDIPDKICDSAQAFLMGFVVIKIKPQKKDFAAWTECVSEDCDLLFIAEKDLGLLPKGVKALPAGKAKKNGKLWTLNNRSWYGYSINRRSHCASIKAGFLEKLPVIELAALGKMQIEAKVPSLIRSSLLPTRIAKAAPLVGGHAWITAGVWRRLKKAEKIATMKAWFAQNELIHQPSIPIAKLPASVRTLIQKNKLDKILHSFRSTSGGNCFATAAAFATGNHKLLDQWMLWTPLKKHLSKSGYRMISFRERPKAEDILIFQTKGNPVHAAIYLGEGVWFEKPGQDFYEPYRLVELRKWKKEWPGAKLTVFRKTDSSA